MRFNMVAVWVVVLLVASWSELTLAKGGRGRGSPSNKGWGGSHGSQSNPSSSQAGHYQPKKGSSKKALKIGAAVAAGAVGGMMVGSVLSSAGDHWRPDSRMRSGHNRYQNINGTWQDGNGGMTLCPLGSVWLMSSVLSFTYCVAV